MTAINLIHNIKLILNFSVQTTLDKNGL